MSPADHRIHANVARRGAGPAAGHRGAALIQYGFIRQRGDRRGVLLDHAVSRGVVATGSGYYARLRLLTVARRPRGTVRGTRRRIIPAQRAPSAQLSLPSLQLAHSAREAVLLVTAGQRLQSAHRLQVRRGKHSTKPPSVGRMSSRRVQEADWSVSRRASRLAGLVPRD